MTRQIFALLFLLSIALWGPAVAEEATPTKSASVTAVVVFSDGQKVEMTSGDPREPLNGLRALLSDPRDGTCEVKEDGKTVLVMVKKGNEVKLTSDGNEKTVTLQEAKDELEIANALSQAGECEGHLSQIGNALEKWAEGHEKAYPQTLSELVPEQLKEIPLCPLSGSDTYSATYKLDKAPVFYQFNCTSDHTAAGIPAGYPAFDGARGVMEGPEERLDPEDLNATRRVETL